MQRRLARRSEALLLINEHLEAEPKSSPHDGQLAGRMSGTLLAALTLHRDHNGMSQFVNAAIDEEPGRDGFSHFFAGFLSALHAPNSAKNRPQLELASDSQWHRAWCVSSGSLVRRAALPSDSQFDWH